MGKNERFKENTRAKSKAEKEIFQLVKGMFPLSLVYLNYPLNMITSTAKNLSADIYIKNLGSVIEIDGEHHFQPVAYGKSEEAVMKAQEAYKEQQKLDREKTRLIEDAELKLIRIPYYEWNKLKGEDKISYLYDKLLEE